MSDDELITLRRIPPQTVQGLRFVTRDDRHCLTGQLARLAAAFRADAPPRIGGEPTRWAPSRIALTGDAVHIMPPFESGGGNTARRDASLLVERLATCLRHSEPPQDAIATYHREMSEYAFPLVRSSMKQLGRINMRNGLAWWVMLELIPSIRSIGSKPFLATT